MTKETIIEKVQKLLALATSSNEHEAAAAAEKAHALLAAHNLSMAEVTTTSDAPVDEVGQHTPNETKCGAPWVRTLWQATARLYFCEYAYSTCGDNTRHYVIGTQANSITAAHMAEFLSKTVMKLSLKARKEQDQSTKWQRSFRQGCGERIRIRLHNRLKELQSGRDEQNTIANANNLPALYQSNSQALRAFMDNEMSVKKSKARSQRYHAGGYNAGQEAGNNVGLDAQITATASSTSTLALGAS